MADLKSAATVLRWLDADVTPHMPARTEAMAHGGTALTLLGVKESTKDVDFSFRQREDFDRFSSALKAMGYRVGADSKARRGEHWLQFRNPRIAVDSVDLHFPTWNNWRLTPRILRKTLTLPIGQIDLVRPDVDVAFLFKTYPLRDSDITDLQRTIDRSPPDEAAVIGLFDEQDAIYRGELLVQDIEYEPLINILELRVRFGGSLELVGPAHRARIPKVDKLARLRFRELGLDVPLRDLLTELRREGLEPPINWDRVLGDRLEEIRERLARPNVPRRKR